MRFVLRHGHTQRRGPLSLKHVHNDRRRTSRIAVVVSKKVSKKAVVRNRIRRRIFETTRRSLHILSQPTDIVITVFDVSVAEVSPDRLETQLTSMLRATQGHKETQR